MTSIAEQIIQLTVQLTEWVELETREAHIRELANKVAAVEHERDLLDEKLQQCIAERDLVLRAWQRADKHRHEAQLELQLARDRIAQLERDND